ncbi:hypothetical protein LGM89_24425 [Burkholderia sp. AU31624]|uniref:hypothetical protein n=1 Tax=unclassified Burkholderia TaxID=2613784 RepID=UPI00117F8EE6|nr:MULTISPECIES: hypothetical protein [unclassified Burkholderia]MCA8256420.1 hypothetical protein [Burkholderia sp. AU31624]
MDLSNSLGYAAFVVSALTAFYAKKQIDLAKSTLGNAYRTQVSDQHARYRDALSEIKRKHKEEILMLSRTAGDALLDIINRVDGYDADRHAGRPLRHLLHESSEMVFYAFKGQLAWQYAENINFRLHRFVHIEDELKPSVDHYAQDGGSGRLFERKYFNDVNSYIEETLEVDRHFCRLVSEMKSRIDRSRSADLLVGIQEDLGKFRKNHAEVAPGLIESSTHLADLIDQDKFGHFPLSESPRLFDAMRRQKTILDTMGKLWIPHVAPDDAHLYLNCVSIGVHACAVLHAFQGVHSWGWTYE